MKKLTVVFSLLAIAALPAVALAHQENEGSNDGPKNPAKHCKALRSAMGVERFREAFGGRRNAFGKCVSERAQLKRRAFRAAVEQCAAERALDPVAFNEKYGAADRAPEVLEHPGGEGRGPEGSRPPEHGDEGGKPEGARPETGEEPPRPEKQDKRAFRNCVHQKVEAAIEALKTAVKECRAEAEADRDAFKEKYGGEGRGNAFQHCVAEHFRANSSE